MGSYVLAIDQGTTSTRAIAFRADTSIAAVAQREFPQHFPADGAVEHEPDDLWTTTVETCRAAMREAGAAARDIAAIGITNQRETTLLWERASGRAVHRAIVWQDRRTADLCARLKAAGHEPLFAAKTGLLLDPYFSGTKLAWLLQHVPGAADKAARGELAFGTVDSYLLWRLTGGKVHSTDATNASRTLLFDIHDGRWDDELLNLLGVPKAVLPLVCDCSAGFGTTDPELFGAAIPICGIAGDQQAALIGQAGFAPGMVKATYGTGCFALLNTGGTPVKSNNKLVATIAYQLDGRRTYALEGSIFVAGAAVQWLRDSLHIVKSAAETGELAQAADPTQEVILVPAFVGLGAPYWRPDARGALFGLTRATGPRELARAALESACFQTADLLAAMTADWRDAAGALKTLRVDGGMANSDWCMQRLADIIGGTVDRPQIK
ncbi:MAG TPA: glycerol kinase GlpK, partial [Xanthobacteraceae bacterium]|nr:glycerol kinase GlpK [Xanthobacteraceae bacterium]